MKGAEIGRVRLLRFSSITTELCGTTRLGGNTCEARGEFARRWGNGSSTMAFEMSAGCGSGSGAGPVVLEFGCSAGRWAPLSRAQQLMRMGGGCGRL